MNKVQEQLQERAKTLIKQLGVLARNDFTAVAATTRFKAYRADEVLPEYASFICSVGSVDTAESGSTGEGSTEVRLETKTGTIACSFPHGTTEARYAISATISVGDYVTAITFLLAQVAAFNAGYPVGSITQNK